MEIIKEFIAKSNNSTKITVVGDVMIDEYYSVTADRVSPEFPIPILLSDSKIPSVSLPGGAANVAHQFSNFNVKKELFAFADSKTIELLESYRIKCITPFFEGSVPVKKRFYDNDFPLCRWDIESVNYGVKASKLYSLQSGLLQRLIRSNPEVVIYSDYDKGVFSLCEGKNSIDWIPENRSWISIVDPKKGPIDKWKGCDVFKPNEKEAAELSGISNWKDQCVYFQNKLGCTSVVITLGSEGVVGRVNDVEFKYVPKNKKQAQSVIGAGDCFVAFLAMGLSYGMDIVDVIQVAYEAGAKYVDKKHNSPIYPYDLCEEEFDPKILASRDFTIAFTNGCFDAGLTRGHIECLKFAKNKCDRLVVGINDDASVERLKGEGRPVLPLDDRIEIVKSLEFVDYVIPFKEDTPLELIEKIKPDIIVKGGDYNKNNVIGKDLAKVVICPYYKSISTTDKLKKLN